MQGIGFRNWVQGRRFRIWGIGLGVHCRRGYTGISRDCRWDRAWFQSLGSRILSLRFRV